MTSNLLKKLAPLLLLGFFPTASTAQTTGPGCIPSKQGYVCDKASFQRRLRASQTIAIDVSPRDRIAHKQLADLIAALGKSPVETAADLTFTLAPPEPDGIHIGPSDQDLAVLRVYGPTPGGKRGNLIWAEVLRGQADLPWPSVVYALIQQFQAKFAKH